MPKFVKTADRAKKEALASKREEPERLTSPGPDDPDYRTCKTCRHLHPEYSFIRRSKLWKTCGWCGNEPKIGHTKDEHWSTMTDGKYRPRGGHKRRRCAGHHRATPDTSAATSPGTSSGVSSGEAAPRDVDMEEAGNQDSS